MLLLTRRFSRSPTVPVGRLTSRPSRLMSVGTAEMLPTATNVLSVLSVFAVDRYRLVSTATLPGPHHCLPDASVNHRALASPVTRVSYCESVDRPRLPRSRLDSTIWPVCVWSPLNV